MAKQCKDCSCVVDDEYARNAFAEYGFVLCEKCSRDNPNDGMQDQHQGQVTSQETLDDPADECIIPDNIKPSVEIEILPPISMDIVRPAVSAVQAAAAWQEFQMLKRAVIDKTDIQRIQGKDFIKKSGWRKLAQYFNLTDDIVQEVREPIGEGEWVWTIKVKCIAANGRYTVGVGKCASNERKFAHVEHDTYATAHTRAKNRAISDMIAAGEVSAEELE